MSVRPDPDALLLRLKQEESRAGRGRLKIFFGFAPGVGKTYRMLQVARDLFGEDKLDVVVGWVESHKRSETAALTLGLELLPRRLVEYRGHRIEEFDLDRALARRPRVLVLDELAHTNAEGSRHTKRWQDVVELLEAGIDVLTTVNVQHVESLNDVVAQITQVRVRETIPDSILEQADEIELVDLAPEELLQRLKEGKIYLGEQAERAATHFFQRGNLLALRELALRQTAQHVDEDVQEYREHHGVSATWPAAERLLVCVGPAPSSARLIRATARMAARLRCSWVAGYVEASALKPLSPASQGRLEEHLRLAESLGASISRLSGARVADALLAYAHQKNITRIVVGKPTHSRLRDRLRGSLLDELVRGSGDVEVHVISGRGFSEPRSGVEDTSERAAPWNTYAWPPLVVALTTVVAWALGRYLSLPDLDTLYLVAVTLVALKLGRGPAVVTALLGVLAYDFFLVPPFYTFAVEDVRYVLTFGMLLGVSLFVSELTTRLKRQERAASAREERTAALFALSRDLGSFDASLTVAEVAARHGAAAFGGTVHIFHADAGGRLALLASTPETGEPDSKSRAVVDWCFEHGRWAGIGTDTLPGAGVVCAPLQAGSARLGVLALRPLDSAALDAEQRSFLDAFCTQIALAFERARLASQAQAAEVRARAEEVRSSLLSAVSHDLRTPLGAITGAASTLLGEEPLAAETHTELLQSISGEAARLERLVGNLLDMTRVESGGLVLKCEWIPLEEMVGSALTRLEARLGTRRIELDIPGDLPLLFVDPVLFEQIFINLLENATKYTPVGSTLELHAAQRGRTLRIELRDHGPGLTPGTEERVFEKFFRGPGTEALGAGLGLAISRGIARAHGAELSARNAVGGGACFELVVPLPDAVPETPTASRPQERA